MHIQVFPSPQRLLTVAGILDFENHLVFEFVVDASMF